MAPEAAAALKLGAQDLYALGVVDRVVPEPMGGAHRDPKGMAVTWRAEIREHLAVLSRVPIDDLLRERLEKYMKMGRVETLG